MLVNDMDSIIRQKTATTGYSTYEVVKELTDFDLKLYDKAFKAENNIRGEITTKDVELVSDVGNFIFDEKLNRDKNTVFGDGDSFDIF